MKLYLRPGWKYLGFFSFLKLLIRIKYGRGGIAYVNYILKRLNYHDYVYDKTNRVKFKVKYSDLIAMSILKSGSYEEGSIHLAMKALLHKPGLFLDIGANFGLYSIYASRVAEVPVIAIDGMPESFSLLMENIELNRLRSKITACNLILSSQPGFAFFGHHTKGNLGSSRIKEKLSKDLPGQFVVDTSSLDGLLDFLILDYSGISLMKLDIEGCEYDVLRSSALFEKGRPSYILTEILEGNEQSRQLVDLLVQHQYVAYTIAGEKYTPNMTIPENNLLFIDCHNLDFLLQVYEN